MPPGAEEGGRGGNGGPPSGSGGEKISALVLAAGQSTRMGRPKPLVRLGDRALLEWVLEALRGARVNETIVVLGADADRVRAALPVDRVRVVVNAAYPEGMSTSLRAGVGALSPEARAFLVVLGDAPFVRTSTIDALIAAYERGGARIVLPVYEGVRGNPVLIDRSLANEVDRITGDQGCRALRLSHPEETREVPVDDPGVIIDLDTPEELSVAAEHLKQGGTLARLAPRFLAARNPLATAPTGPRVRTRARPDVLAVAVELERRREPYCLAVVTHVRAPTSGKPGSKALVRADGSVVGWIGGSCSRHALLSEARAALEDGVPRVLRLRPGTEARPPSEAGTVDRVLECDSGGSMEIYLEPHGPAPQLVVIGDSPVAEALSSLGRLLGLRVVVAGPGIEPSRFPDADEIAEDLSELGAKLDRTSYGVVATMASYDAMGLEVLLRSPAPYVALVASRRRAERLREELRGRGVAEERILRLKSPAGLDLAAQTPEEIALSVAAEIVRERRSTRPNPSAAGGAAGHGSHPPASIDPVCQMEVDPASTPLRSTYDGATYYFCSESCLERFEAEPAAFVR